MDGELMDEEQAPEQIVIKEIDANEGAKDASVVMPVPEVPRQSSEPSPLLQPPLSPTLSHAGDKSDNHGQPTATTLTRRSQQPNSLPVPGKRGVYAA
jgi:hypothetical protein